MGLARLKYRLGAVKQEIEFAAILIWILFFPGKTSFLYYLTTAVIILFFLLKNLFFIKNIALSALSYGLIIINAVFLFSTVFSVDRLKSILFVADVFLISVYFFFYFSEEEDQERHYRLIAVLISVFSLVSVLDAVFHFSGEAPFFFENPILSGIVSGLGMLICLVFLTRGFSTGALIMLAVNTASIFASQSKAAFLGTVLMSFYILFLKNRKWILVVVAGVVLTFLIPNPLRNMFMYSLKKDPYAFDRINIWQQSLRMFADYPLAGVGPDNFEEVSKKYNFRQEKGPARYSKIPRRPHSDYLKILTETGVAGALVLAVFLFFALRRIFSPPRFHISKFLALYLLFQGLWFNFVFQFFFFFLVVFLAKDFCCQKQTFRSLTLWSKTVMAGGLLFILIFCYLLPFVSDMYLTESARSEDVVSASSLLRRAETANPLNRAVFYAKGRLFYRYFEKTDSLKAFDYGVENLRRARRLSRHYLAPYLLEADFYTHLLRRGVKYPGLKDEIMGILDRAADIAPYNPFIRMQQAEMYWEFGAMEEAEAAAREALAIEPQYAGALSFLHRHYGYLSEEEFRAKIAAIRAKAIAYKPQPGSYLDTLFTIPEG